MVINLDEQFARALHAFLGNLLYDCGLIRLHDELGRQINGDNSRSFEFPPAPPSTADSVTGAQSSTAPEADPPALQVPSPELPTDWREVMAGQHLQPPAAEPALTDKQWSAILNAGIAHGLTLDATVQAVCEIFRVGSIKELPQSKFQDALGIVSGKSLDEIAAIRSAARADGAGKADGNGGAASTISSKQWTNILSAGCYIGLGVDGTEAFILQKFNVKTRNLSPAHYDAALEAVRSWKQPNT